MSATRREFIRRVVAASGLLATGMIGLWELLESQPPNSAGAEASTAIQPLAPSTANRTAVETVTVTQYVSGGSTQVIAGPQTSQQTAQSTGTSGQVPAGYILVTALSALAGKTSAYFNHPSRGLSLLVNFAGQWRAFSATCTHAPCTVQFAGSSIQCPCHGGTFSPSNGAVQGGPPPSPLPQMTVLIENNDLYVTA